MNDRFEIGLRGMQSCIIYADPGFIIAPSLDLGDLNIASWALFPLAPPPPPVHDTSPIPVSSMTEYCHNNPTAPNLKSRSQVCDAEDHEAF